MESVRTGGSATSMLNLLEFFKERGIEAYVCLFENEGIFVDRARTAANLLPEDKVLAAIRCSKHKLKSKGLQAYVIRLLYVIVHKMIGVEKANGLFYKSRAKKFDNKYDAVIAYQEQIPTEFVQHIKSKRKLAWCHMDYDTFCDNKSIEYHQALYSHFDEVVCVSDIVRNSMIEKVKLDPNHVHKIYNTIPPEFINNSAKEEISIEKKEFTFVSVGRFVKRKGFDRVVSAAIELKQNGISFIWYILGNGEEFDNIASLVKKNNLEDYVILPGVKSNPFPYIKAADAYVMASSNEAQPMVMNEALTLGVPVISTSFGSAKEVVMDGVNGIITENSAEGVINGVNRFIADGTLREKITNGAKKFVYDNEGIVNKILQLIQVGE